MPWLAALTPFGTPPSPTVDLSVFALVAPSHLAPLITAFCSLICRFFVIDNTHSIEDTSCLSSFPLYAVVSSLLSLSAFSARSPASSTFPLPSAFCCYTSFFSLPSSSTHSSFLPFIPALP